MKTPRIVNAVGFIDDELIADASREAKVKKSPWLKFGTMAACLCLVVTAVWAPIMIRNLRSFNTGKDQYGNTVSYVGWSDDVTIPDGALNSELLQNDTSGHLPIFKLDTLKDLEEFKIKYESILSMDQSYDNVLSFDGVLNKSQWNREDFYNDNSLLLIYVPSPSGSLRFGVRDVVTEGDSICIYVEQKNDPEIFTEDMAGWLILVELDDEEANGYTSFDAVFNAK